MRKKAIGKTSALLILISIAVSFCLPVCAAENPAAAYEGKKIGVLTGSIHDEIVKKYNPDSECVNLLFYCKTPDTGSTRQKFSDAFAQYDVKAETEKTEDEDYNIKIMCKF